MGIFFLAAINEPNKVEAAVKENFPNACYDVPENHAWLVEFDGTTKELSDKLGITSGKSGTGVVLSVTNYYGRAPTDMWEWMKTRMERQ